MVRSNDVKEAEMKKDPSNKSVAEVVQPTNHCHSAEEERLKKQREIKRHFRARQKSHLMMMRTQVKELEKEYERLYIESVAQQQQKPPLNPSSLELSVQYQQTRAEVERLRVQNATMEKELVKRARFASLLASYRIEFELPRELPFSREQEDRVETVDDIDAVLSAEECSRIIAESYQIIFHAKPPVGRRLSSGAKIFGWSDERYFDGTTLQYSLKKAYPFVSAHHMMEQSWAILTQEERIQKLYPLASLRVLQVVNDDMIVFRRWVRYASLDIDICTDMLVFRMQTNTGYVVAYRSIDQHSSLKKSNSQHLSNEDGLPHRVVWNSSFEWQRFDDEELVVADTVVVADSELPSFFPQGASQCSVTCGGRIQNKHYDVAKFFVTELICIVIRWEQAIIRSKLCG